LLADEAEALDRARSSSDPYSPWARADGWRLGHRGARLECFDVRGTRIEVRARGHGGDYELAWPGHAITVTGARLDGGWLTAAVDGIRRRLRVFVDARTVSVHDGTRRTLFARVPAFAFEGVARGAGDRLVAPMPGRIVAVRTAPGREVREGEELLVMEAMKMELSLKAPRDGCVREVRATEGAFVEADAVLVELEPVA
jgi:3-methylcrotonyl-CoA carboxylase alpha subunit